jgi:hypothetical protein
MASLLLIAVVWSAGAALAILFVAGGAMRPDPMYGCDEHARAPESERPHPAYYLARSTPEAALVSPTRRD